MPLPEKFVKQNKRIKAHDEKNEAANGDLVKIIECRPISKDKTWRLTEIVEKVEKG